VFMLPRFESSAMTSPNPPADLEPATIRDVIEQMRTLEAALSATDGVAFFNHLYLRVTEAVAAAITAGVFADRAFMERLDVIFGGLPSGYSERRQHFKSMGTAIRVP
jgi:hypothetical protein